MTTDQTDREALLEIEKLLDRADRLEAEARLNSSTADSSAGDSSARETIGYVEFMARRAGISVEEQERRMRLAPRAGQNGRG